MKTTLHRLKQRVRTGGINVAGKGLYWAGKIHSKRDGARGQIYWQDKLRWCLEGKLETVFGWFWHGSDEEIQAVYNGEIPPEWMSERQRAEFDQYDPSLLVTHCCTPGCRWSGVFSQSVNNHCPRCKKTGLYLEPFAAA